jgi:CheY-like chemotaxis protein
VREAPPPPDLPSAISLYEKESSEVETKLRDSRVAGKGKKLLHFAKKNQIQPDLVKAGDPGRTVISVGTLPEVLSLREAVLKSVGYTVFTATNPQEAATRIRNGECGVLLLCYSVQDEWRGQLIREFRETCPQGRVVAITNGNMAEVPKEVDELIFGIEGAEALIDAVRGNGP